MHQPALGARKVADRLRGTQHVGPELESQLGAELQMREQHAALGSDLQTADRQRMPQPKEDERIVRTLLTLDVFE